MEWNKELIEKAKTAKNVEELLVLAKENGIEMTEEQAKEYFAKLNTKSRELDDDELDNVAGGCGEERLESRVDQGNMIEVINNRNKRYC